MNANPLAWYLEAARRWGPLGVSVFAAALAGLALAAALVALPEAGVDTTPTRDDMTLNVVAASGLDGFPAKAFCEDPLTGVRSFVAPDSAGLTFELARTRDGKAETVVAVLSLDGTLRFATHYFDAFGGQASEPADMAGSFPCIEKKARP